MKKFVRNNVVNNKIVEDEEVELVETHEQSIEIEIALSDLHFLDEARGSGGEHLEALAHEGEVDGEGLNACFGQGRDEAEIKSSEVHAGEEFGLLGMSVEAPVVPFG